eukprot:jgi/Chrzof1/10034/Cz04g24250.t1
MMYMPDCLDATWRLITAPRECLQQTTYNVTAMSFTPQQLAEAIAAYVPHFQITYTPDFREQIAKTWPASIDDSAAREDWEWSHTYDLHALVHDMLCKLAPGYGKPVPTRQHNAGATAVAAAV